MFYGVHRYFSLKIFRGIHGALEKSGDEGGTGESRVIGNLIIRTLCVMFI